MAKCYCCGSALFWDGKTYTNDGIKCTSCQESGLDPEYRWLSLTVETIQNERSWNDSLYGKIAWYQMGVEFWSVIYQLRGLEREISQMAKGGLFGKGYASEKCTKIQEYASEWFINYNDAVRYANKINWEGIEA